MILGFYMGIMNDCERVGTAPLALNDARLFFERGGDGPPLTAAAAATRRVTRGRAWGTSPR